MIEDTLVELEKFGFKNPSVIPVSARAARLFKMALHGKTDFTKKEINDFEYYICFFTHPENDFCLLVAGIRGEAAQNTHYDSPDEGDIVIRGKSYEREQITKALFNTGIPVVENILNDHKE
jgi:hypothetical protein